MIHRQLLQTLAAHQQHIFLARMPLQHIHHTLASTTRVSNSEVLLVVSVTRVDDFTKTLDGVACELAEALVLRDCTNEGRYLLGSAGHGEGVRERVISE
jgi:hypothetical protein